MSKSIKELDTMPRLDRNKHWHALTYDEKGHQMQIVMNHHKSPFSPHNRKATIELLIALIISIFLLFLFWEEF